MLVIAEIAIIIGNRLSEASRDYHRDHYDHDHQHDHHDQDHGHDDDGAEGRCVACICNGISASAPHLPQTNGGGRKIS